MNQHPVQLLEPVFRFLDRQIHENGDILFMLLVYATTPLIVWILCGGLRRKSNGQSHITVVPFFMIRPPTPPPTLPPIGDDLERERWDCDGDHGGQVPD